MSAALAMSMSVRGRVFIRLDGGQDSVAEGLVLPEALEDVRRLDEVGEALVRRSDRCSRPRVRRHWPSRRRSRLRRQADIRGVGDLHPQRGQGRGVVAERLHVGIAEGPPQQAKSSRRRRTSRNGMSRLRMMSQSAMRPPGARTRTHSRSRAALSRIRCDDSRTHTTSKASSSRPLSVPSRRSKRVPSSPRSAASAVAAATPLALVVIPSTDAPRPAARSQAWCPCHIRHRGPDRRPRWRPAAASTW